MTIRVTCKGFHKLISCFGVFGNKVRLVFFANKGSTIIHLILAKSIEKSKETFLKEIYK